MSMTFTERPDETADALLALSGAAGSDWSSDIRPFHRSGLSPGEVVLPARAAPLPRAFTSLPHATGLRFGESDGWDGTSSGRAFTSDIPQGLERAVPRRLAGYLAGRYCAALALRAMGMDDVHVSRAADGAPRWPLGSVGSITHTATRAFAAVASCAEVRSLGIDCEPLLSPETAREVASTVCPEHERVTVVTSDPEPLDVATIVSIAFSAKESVYKSLSPLVETFFGFEAVRLISIDSANGTTELRLCSTLGADFPRGADIRASFSIEDGHVFTAVVTQVTA